MGIEPQEPQSTDHTLMSTDDAMVWAEEFCRIFDGHMIGQEAVSYTDNHQRINEGLMVGWFANAMQVAVNMYETRRVHALGELTETEQFLKTWEEEHPSEADEIIDIIEGIQEDEMEQRILEDQFIEGFYDGRNDHIDPYGDTP